MTPDNRLLRAELTRRAAWTNAHILEHFTIACRAYYLGAKTPEHATIVSWTTHVPRTDLDAIEAMRMVAIAGMHGLVLKDLVEERLGWSWGKFVRARRRAARAICLALNASHIHVENRLKSAGIHCVAA